jgi:hypothetical protein
MFGFSYLLDMAVLNGVRHRAKALWRRVHCVGVLDVRGADDFHHRYWLRQVRGRSGNCPRYHECYCRSQPANEHRLDCATDRWRACEAALDVAETTQGDQSGDCRYCERCWRWKERCTDRVE